MADDKKNGQSAPPDQPDLAVGAVEEVGEEDVYALRVIEIPKSKWLRRYRSVAFQIAILCVLSFSGPSMSNGK